MKLRNVIFYVKDIEKSKEFYNKLGFKKVQDFGSFVSYGSGFEGVYFSITEPDNIDKMPGKQVCAFWSEDIQEFYKKVNDLSLSITVKLYEASFGKTFTLEDPDGNKIEFVQI